MRLKQNSVFALIFGFVILLVGAVMPLIYWGNYTSRNGTIGIIVGSAAPPSYTFMLSALFDGLPIILILFGISIVISSVFCLLFSKTVNVCCNIYTSVLSLGLSAVSAIGLVCAFLWFTIVSFGEMSKHPIEYPASILLGILCFLAFAVLIVLYFKACRINWSIKGIVIDALTFIVYLPTFSFLFMYLYELIT